MSNNLLTPTGHMRRALRLAAKGHVLPNPMVGAVIVKNGRRIAEGFHKKYGGDHAEIEAIKNSKEDLREAELYVNLEPCCHIGKTRPCTDTIIKAGIKKVIICSLDPSEKVNGKGLDALQKAGIEVEVGLLKKEAEELNEQFYTFHTEHRPFISLKVAMSINGKIAENNNSRTYLTGVKAKKNTHILRAKHHGVLVGAGTALADNPNLAVSEIESEFQPVRLIMEGARPLPQTLKIFRDKNYIVLKDQSVKEALKTLYEKEIISIIVEGGQRIFTAFIKERLFDRLYIYIAPEYLGKNAIDFAILENELSLKLETVQKLGEDVFLSFSRRDI